MAHRLLFKCSYRSDSVARHWPVALRVRAAQAETRKGLAAPAAVRLGLRANWRQVSTRILSKTTRDAVRNKEWWKRRHTPTQDPGTNKAKNPFPFASRFYAARTLNATGQYRVTLSLRLGRVYN